MTIQIVTPDDLNAAVATLNTRITNVESRLEKLMESVDAIQAALSQLVADTSTALQDIAAKIAALEGQVLSPEVAQQIVTDITNLDNAVKAADPGPPGGP